MKMIRCESNKDGRLRKFGIANQGFTLIELMVAVAIGAIILAGMVSSYTHLTELWQTQRQLSRMYQKLRGSIYLMALDFQGAGRSGLMPRNEGDYGLTDITRYALDQTPTSAGNPASSFVSLTTDTDGDGDIDDSDAPTTTTYRLYDPDNDGRPDLGRDTGGGMQLVAEGIDAFSLAYAIDADRDGNLDRTAGGNIIWAVDSDNDGRLDSNLDANDDGQVDENDDINGDAVIDQNDIGAALASQAASQRIRQVRMFMLTRSDRVSRNYLDTNTYAVGHQVIQPPNDGFRRRVFSMSVTLRNREEDLQN